MNKLSQFEKETNLVNLHKKLLFHSNPKKKENHFQNFTDENE